MKDGERERPIENYGKKEQKEWLDNILPDPHPFTAGNKEEEHSARSPVVSSLHYNIQYSPSAGVPRKYVCPATVLLHAGEVVPTLVPRPSQSCTSS